MAQGHCTGLRQAEQAAPGPAGTCPASTVRLGAARHSIHRDILGEKGDLQLPAGPSPSPPGFQGHSAALGAD